MRLGTVFECMHVACSSAPSQVYLPDSHYTFVWYDIVWYGMVSYDGMTRGHGGGGGGGGSVHDTCKPPVLLYY